MYLHTTWVRSALAIELAHPEHPGKLEGFDRNHSSIVGLHLTDSSLALKMERVYAPTK